MKAYYVNEKKDVLHKVNHFFTVLSGNKHLIPKKP